MRTILVAIGIAVIGAWSPAVAVAVDLMYGCCSRPACGKVCKLVCEPTKLTAVGYGCKCKEICIPGPSQPGCKHCETRCCCDTDMKGARPKIEFCWYDWFACGCAQPRTVRVLTKYQAEKEIPFFHWEVVDGCDCCCPGPCRCVYKPAPADAQVGDVLALSPDEQVQVTSYLAQPEAVAGPSIAPANDAANGDDASESKAKSSAWKRLANVFSSDEDAQTR